LNGSLPARFSEARRGFLATAGSDAQSSVVPVCFAAVGGHVYIAIDEKPKSGRPLRRLRNIEENARVSLSVDCYEEDWRRLWWVMVQGAAAVLSRGSDRPEALSALRAKYSQYRTMRLEDRPLIEITVERVVEWSAEPQPQTGAT
jgi:PPOX class probable F420-dependent enzyme